MGLSTRPAAVPRPAGQRVGDRQFRPPPLVTLVRNHIEPHCSTGRGGHSIHQHDDTDSPAFRHEALFYEGLDDLVARAVPFIREGLEAQEPVAVAMVSEKIDALRDSLGSDRDSVAFIDMARVGRNPARLLPAFHRFVDERGTPGKKVRGVGEPIWSGRSSHELVECHLHEALLNVAFSPSEPVHLLCPYDVGALGDAVIHEARCSHPHVAENGSDSPSREYRGEVDVASPFDLPLPPPTAPAEVLSFEAGTLHEVRELVSRSASRVGLGLSATTDLVLAVNELALNSVAHGGGNGVLRVWRDDGALVCEVRDRGRLTDPLAGRRLPPAASPDGRGLWLVNQLCDLVQIRSAAGAGTVVRVLMSLDSNP